MSRVPYLLRLTNDLGKGARRLPDEMRARHSAYLRSMQNPDGGFGGRAGGSDLYYTAFALRGLAVLGALDARVANRAAEFLRQSLNRPAAVVDFFSLLYAALLLQMSGGPDVFAAATPDWPRRASDTLETFRTADGGYGKAPGAAAGSTYQGFLVGLCYQVLGRDLPRPHDLVHFVMSRRRGDGGFVEFGPLPRGATNPTAAAVGLLQLLEPDVGPLAPDVATAAAEFLVGMADPSGGFRANARAPLPDLLSTFTAAWTLSQLGHAHRLDCDALGGFVRSLERSEGGFWGVIAWDECCDVEYTFYGLGSLALLAL
jgi:geranylgeranyl transferase type-2 subunit beta